MRERPKEATRTIRCAIYTRKSSEEGLEQDFNSLDAQREACAAYITSQRHEGWTLLPDYYDDGGYSGGSMERPALKALLAEVALGRVDVIVVYKVDRLTRSLADFAKIVDILDGREASFVSVTQSFNTTTSMGRLTLNVLLSFAQFEREVTGERIRDKIAASKAKGMWMGGIIPLGYRAQDRRLVIDPIEAKIVRHIFTRYVELGSGLELMRELAAEGIRSKAGVTRHGKPYGGHRLGRGAIYAILQNRLYVGEVVHHGQHYPGQHQAIIETDLFECVQHLLATRRVERKSRSNTAEASLLAGLFYDRHGRHMSPSHSNKAGRRYRYYRSQTEAVAQDQPCWRVSAPDIEGLVIAMIEEAVVKAVAQRIDAGDCSGHEIERLRTQPQTLIQRFNQPGAEQRLLIQQLVRRITIDEKAVNIVLDMTAVDPVLHGIQVEHAAPIAFLRTGDRVRLVIPAPMTERKPDMQMLRLIGQAFTARRIVEGGSSLETLAKQSGQSVEYAAALLRISYLAPSMIEAMLQGTQPVGLTRRDLIRTPRIPIDWSEQQRLFDIA